jgi:hypothetical protein
MEIYWPGKQFVAIQSLYNEIIAKYNNEIIRFWPLLNPVNFESLLIIMYNILNLLTNLTN